MVEVPLLVPVRAGHEPSTIGTPLPYGLPGPVHMQGTSGHWACSLLLRLLHRHHLL